MLATVGNRFSWWTSNYTGPPNFAIIGDSISSHASANTLGTTVELLSAAEVTDDVYGVMLCLNRGFSTGAQRNFLVNILTDPAGGTSWSTVIPNLAVLGPGSVGESTASQQSGGCWFYFPLFIKAGSSIAANCQSNLATGSAIGVAITVYGKPTRPEMIRVGSYVEAFGVNTGTSLGTTMTVGTSGAAGTYAQMGSNTTRPFWWWQVGITINDLSVTGHPYMCDISQGDVTTKDIIIDNLPIMTTNTEALGLLHPIRPGSYCEVATGTGIWGRVSCGGATADTAVGMAVYGLGG